MKSAESNLEMEALIKQMAKSFGPASLLLEPVVFSPPC